MISNQRFPISKIAFKSFPIVEVRILSVCRLNAKPLHRRTKHSVSFTNVLNVLKHSVSFTINLHQYKSSAIQGIAVFVELIQICT